MLRCVTISLFLLLAVQFTFAQQISKTENQDPFRFYSQNPMFLSVGNGVMHYYGDLTDGFDPSFLRPSTQVDFFYYLTPQISLRSGILMGGIYANDVKSQYYSHMARNLHFRSSIFELNTLVSYELLRNRFFSSLFSYRGGFSISPYLFIGLGFFHFNPQAEFEDSWIDLHPLGTEGQYIGNGPYSNELQPSTKVSYSLWQWSIPMGGGIKFHASNNLWFSFEAGLRKTFTDYLDDVSTVYPNMDDLEATPNGQLAVSLSDRAITQDVQGEGAPRGNPDHKDYYFGFSLNVS
ncbi:MAG: hypothetical protein IH946_09060, partial [Bacteroidetes bacterium]|nr:hypothetical protein [Bacteroidota bacterium]